MTDPAWKGIDITPCRRPGESEEEFERRVVAQEAAHQRLLAIYSDQGMANTALAAGVGTFDSNGNPKGTGWW